MSEIQIRFRSAAIKINAILVALGLISLLASINPAWHLWGVDSFAIFPLWLRGILIILLIITSIPSVAQRLGKAIVQRLRSLSHKRRRLIYLVIIGLMLLIFVFLSSNNLLLGDGYNVRANIASGMTFSLTEPLDFLVHHLVFLLTHGGEAGAQLSYQLCSYLLGLIFFIGLLLFVKDTEDLLLVFAAALGFAVLQFFFGYVEDYSFAFVAAFFYLMSAGRDMEKRSLSPGTVIFLVLGICFHLSYLVLGPSVIYLLWFLNRRRAAIRVISIWIALTVAILIAYIIWFRSIVVTDIFVPLWPKTENPYHLFSIAHLADFAKLILLSIPLLFAIPFLYKFIDRVIVGFYLLALVPALIFILVVDPKIGMFRDWDLMSIASAPTLAFLIKGLIAWQRAYKGFGYIIFAPLLIFAFTHTGSWILQNTSKDNSYDQIKQYVQQDVHYSVRYHKGYLNKAWSTIVSKYYKNIDEEIRADELRYKGDPNDTLNVCNLAGAYSNKGDTSKALTFVFYNWKRFVNSSYAILRLTDVMLETGRYPEAEMIYGAYVERGGRDHRILFNLGLVEEQLGRSDSAAVLYDQAFVRWTDAPINDELGFYIKATSLKKYQIGESGLKRIYPQIPDQYKDLSKLLIDALEARNYMRVDSLLARLMQHTTGKRPVLEVK